MNNNIQNSKIELINAARRALDAQEEKNTRKALCRYARILESARRGCDESIVMADRGEDLRKCPACKIPSDYVPTSSLCGSCREAFAAAQLKPTKANANETRGSIKKHALKAPKKLKPLVPEGEKWCPKCNCVKPKSEFWRETRRGDGLSCYCKTCKAADSQKRNAAYYQAHKTVILQRSLDRKERLRRVKKGEPQ